MVIGNNTASDISKFCKTPRATKRRVVFGKFWNITSRYYCQIPVQVMLLFVYNRSREIFGNAQETFLFTVGKKKQTQASTFVTIFLRQWKKWLTVFVKPVQTIQHDSWWSVKVSPKGEKWSIFRVSCVVRCSEVDSAWLTTSGLANQRAPKALFT